MTTAESQNFPLVQRFHSSGWSRTRTLIHDLAPGGEVVLPKSEFNNATSSIQRLQIAYEHTRHYHLHRIENGILVRRSADGQGCGTAPPSNRPRLAWHYRRHSPPATFELTDIQLCYFAALVYALRLINEKADELGIEEAPAIDAEPLVTFVRRKGDRLVAIYLESKRATVPHVLPQLERAAA